MLFFQLLHPHTTTSKEYLMKKNFFYAIHNPLHKPCLQVPRVYLFLFKMPAKTANHDQSSYFQLLNYAEVISLSCTIFVCKQCAWKQKNNLGKVNPKNTWNHFIQIRLVSACVCNWRVRTTGIWCKRKIRFHDKI